MPVGFGEFTLTTACALLARTTHKGRQVHSWLSLSLEGRLCKGEDLLEAFQCKQQLQQQHFIGIYYFLFLRYLGTTDLAFLSVNCLSEVPFVLSELVGNIFWV